MEQLPILNSLDLRYMQVQTSIQSISKLPAVSLSQSFSMIEFIALISKSRKGITAFCRLVFDDKEVLNKEHSGMEILEVKSRTLYEAFAKVLFNGPVPMFISQNEDLWWVSPTHLTPSGVTITIRGTKSAIRSFRKNLLDSIDDNFSVKLSSESYNSPEFLDMLPPKQRLVLDKAIEMGYYNRPRECTQRNIAEVLKIKQATVSEHLQSAESNIIHLIST